jgi:hypothetical protein
LGRYEIAKCPKKKDDNNKSVGTLKSKSLKSSKLAKLGKMKKEWKKQKKSFATLEAQLEEANDSDLTDSDNEEDGEAYHFQVSFQQVHATLPSKLDMKNVILFDNESTMDLFCNKAFTTRVYNTKKKVTIQSNGATLVARKLATIEGYQHKVWFDKRAITNILSLANVSKQYRVTYDSGNSKDFIVHRDAAGLPDMHFRLHNLGLHVYNPKLEQLAFLNIVQDNMEGFTK